MGKLEDAGRKADEFCEKVVDDVKDFSEKAKDKVKGGAATVSGKVRDKVDQLDDKAQKGKK